jgi:hypothetical protein
MLPILPFQIPAKALRCCGPLVLEDDGQPWMENADFQQPLSSQPARQLLNSQYSFLIDQGAAVNGARSGPEISGLHLFLPVKFRHGVADCVGGHEAHFAVDEQ